MQLLFSDPMKNNLFNLSNNKKLLLNIAFQFVYQFTLILYGIIVPILVIKTYGNFVNGFISSINTFVGLAVVFQTALISFINSENYKLISLKTTNKLISNTKSIFSKFFFLFIIYFVLVFFYFIQFNNSAFINGELLVFFILLSKFIDLIYLSRYKSLFISTNNSFFISLFSTILLILEIITYIAFSKIFPLYLLKILFFIFQLLFFGILKISSDFFIIKNNILTKQDSIINAERIDSTNKNPINYSILLSVSTYFLNTYFILYLTFVSEIELLSIYTIYFFIVNGTLSLFSSFANSFISYFGINKNSVKNKINFSFFTKHYYFLFNTIFFSIVSVIIPFLFIYASGLNVDYLFPDLLFLVIIDFYFAGIRAPLGVLVLSNGLFKSESINSVIHLVLFLIIGFVFYLFIGSLGIILASIISNILRFFITYNNLLQNRLFQKGDVDKTNIFFFSILFLIYSFVLYYSGFNLYSANYFEWVLKSSATFIIFLIGIFVINLIVYKKNMFKIY